MSPSDAPVLVDTHCHLDGHYLKEPLADVLERARVAGVGALVCIGVGGVDAAREAVALAEAQPRLVATVGVHPHEAAECDDAGFDAICALTERDEVVAVGEVGLDYHYDHSPRETQRAVFRRFVAEARRVDKPLVIHTRLAAADTLEILESAGARDVGGVIHCFSEDVPFARRALDLGFDLSFSGIVTFKSARAVHEVAVWAPADRILVETDSPYLAPVPKRGKPNEPGYVVYTAQRVAELRGVSLEELSRLTTDNATRRFGPALARALAAPAS